MMRQMITKSLYNHAATQNQYNYISSHRMINEQSTLINNDCKYKIVFLGDASVGKTSLVQHIMHGTCKPTYQPTICLQSGKKMIVHNNQVYKLMLWDTAGQQKFHSLIPSFVRGCDCAVIVYDVTNKDSLINCQKWLKLLRENNSQHHGGAVLVGNKIDLGKNVNTSQGFELALKNKLSYIEASATTGKGLQQLVTQIVETIQKTKNKSQRDTRSTDSELNSSRKLAVPNLPTEIKIKKSNCCSV